MPEMDVCRTYTCYLCGGDQALVRPGHARDNHTLVPLECRRCGLVVLSSSDHITDSFYTDAHMHDNTPCDPELELLQGREDSERRVNQFRHLVEGKRVLDIGCGSGGFLLQARQYAASVAGVEPEARLQDFYTKHELQVYPSLGNVSGGGV